MEASGITASLGLLIFAMLSCHRGTEYFFPDESPREREKRETKVRETRLESTFLKHALYFELNLSNSNCTKHSLVKYVDWKRVEKLIFYFFFTFLFLFFYIFFSFLSPPLLKVNWIHIVVVLRPGWIREAARMWSQMNSMLNFYFSGSSAGKEFWVSDCEGERKREKD